MESAEIFYNRMYAASGVNKGSESKKESFKTTNAEVLFV
jgi:hypothetical protein